MNYYVEEKTTMTAKGDKEWFLTRYDIVSLWTE
jgi:hypothetical protein